MTSGSAESISRVVVPRLGGPEVLRVQRVRLPSPAKDEVRMRMLACAVSFADILMREGTYLGGPRPPFTPGYGLIGHVNALGEDVDTLCVGDLGAALTVTGSYAGAICVPARDVVRVPTSIDAVLASTLVVNYLTAYQLLHRVARIKKGDRVLVHGAAGAVGSALVELATLVRARVAGTCGTESRTFVEKLGAQSIDYRNEDFVDRTRTLFDGGADVVLDGIGGNVSIRSAYAVRRGGLLVLFGHHATLLGGRRSYGRWAAWYVDAARTWILARRRGVRVAGYRIAKLKEDEPSWYRDDLAALIELLVAGRVHPVVAATFPLESVAEAHALLGRGGHCGHVVVT